MADVTDLKSVEEQSSCGFESHRRHQHFMRDFFSFLTATILDIFLMKSVYSVWEKTIFAALAFLSAVMMTRSVLKVK